MSQLVMFLIAVAGGCFFGLLMALLVRDILHTRIYNRVAHACGKPEMLFRILCSHAFAALSLGIALGFFGCASVIGYIFIRDTVIR